MFRGVGQGSGPAGKVMPESSFLFSSVVPACGFCLQVQSRSRGVKESRSWEANRRPHLSGCSLGRRSGHSWTFRLVDLPAPELGERVGGQDSEKNTKYYERSQYVIENTWCVWKTNPKRTPNELQIECSMRALNTEFELFEATRVPVEVLRLQRPAAAHEPATLSPRRGLYYSVGSGREKAVAAATTLQI